MQDSARPAPPQHLGWLIVNHAISAMVIGLCAAVPTTTLAFLLALAASCITTHGCNTPTIAATLMPLVAVSVWVPTTVIVGAHLIRTLLTDSAKSRGENR